MSPSWKKWQRTDTDGACMECGGSGVLTILESIDFDATGRAIISDVPYVSYCHACPAGAAWQEAGLE